ncbi:MMPL family transporter [Alteromonas sp. 1_MG-2023]|uniref:MMPL family transporter n=1 Tax=Alteromonas sp. 1_MG-2023 TaxID=3062669 RepID=UPI0026E1E647|nr:MMPL family transporter [Alteromonas sp. 1_MG-2023]MDO6566966.1 MMPL family transporter [Alteromonas sp. 1_MG-2023]
MKGAWFRPVGIAWLLTVAALALFAVSRPATFDSSIMSLLPTSEQEPLAQQAIQQTSERFSKRLLLLVSGSDENAVKQSVQALATRAQQVLANADVRWQVEANQRDSQREALFPYRFALLDDSSREALISGNYQGFENRTIASLFSPIAAGKVELVDDPFGFYAQRSQAQTSDINIHINHSLLKVNESELPTYVLLITLKQEPYSLEIQRVVMEFLANQTQLLAEQGITLRSSGMILHAAAGADQARAEISTIGIGSLVGIIILLLIVFRRLKPIFLMLFPISVGCLTAVSATLLIFGKVHLITLAFGAGLVGVSIDYALHFVCERQQSDNEKVLPNILPGLILGLFSSVLAYAVQAFAPFPGLQQMAVFSVVGLLASWLTVVLTLPLITANDAKIKLPLAEKLFRLRNKIPRIVGRPVPIIAIMGITVGAATLVYTGTAQDDIRLLQTSPERLLQQEKSIQTLLGTQSSTQFILVKGDTIEDALLKEQALLTQLKPLQKDNTIPPAQAVSMQVPAQARQADNYALVARLYKAKLEGLFTTLNLPEHKRIEAQNVFSETRGNTLTIDEWLGSENSEAWRDLVVSTKLGASATTVRFKGHLNQDAKSAIEQLIEDDSQLVLIDQVSNISALMKTYRIQVSQLIALAYAVVFLVLAWRYRQQVLRVILPPFLASIITLASISFLEGGMNMFHLLALILVLGIGLDMGIFMAESGESKNTWLAVSMSTFTSLLAFGLLAWSQTPVLHHFGMTVLIGLTLVWVMTPAIRYKSSDKTQK